MKPEEETEIILYNWLKEKGAYVQEIYFNRMNKINAPVFTTTGVNKKPDFVIKINRGYGEEYIAVEIKDNNRSAQVYDAGKILMYYDNYLTGETIYYINNKSIKISYFLIATQGSIEAKLFNKSRELQLESNIWDHSDRATQVNWGNEPSLEWNGTSQFFRNLLSTFRTYRKDKKIIKLGGPGLGILTSKIEPLYTEIKRTAERINEIKRLNETTGTNFPLSIYEIDRDKCINNNQPHIFIMNFNNYNPNYKIKWGCRYWRI
jgi:hypothetical protein